MVYKLKVGARVKTDAQTIGAVCEELEKSGNLTAKGMVDVSRPEDAPLHPEFEWNDPIAAELYREEQARYLIRSVIVVSEEERRPVRAFFKLKTAESKYESINVIVHDEDKTRDLLKMALGELRAFENKYEAIRQYLEPVYDAIAQIEATTAKRNPPSDDSAGQV